LIIDIDIGVQGAVAVLDQSGALVEIHDMPTLQDGPAGRRAVNAPLLASITLKPLIERSFTSCKIRNHFWNAFIIKPPRAHVEKRTRRIPIKSDPRRVPCEPVSVRNRTSFSHG
jgi:hypothetical protein